MVHTNTAAEQVRKSHAQEREDRELAIQEQIALEAQRYDERMKKFKAQQERRERAPRSGLLGRPSRSANGRIAGIAVGRRAPI